MLILFTKESNMFTNRSLTIVASLSAYPDKVQIAQKSLPKWQAGRVMRIGSYRGVYGYLKSHELGRHSK
jgi:hypothetical protein